MVGRRQQLTNTPSHDNLRTKSRKQRSWEMDFFFKQTKRLLLKTQNSTWSQMDFFFINSCSSSSSSPPFIHQPLHHLLIAPGDYKVLAVVTVMNVFRSICGGRLRVPTHRTPVWRSTSVGMWTTKPRWNHRSRRSICAPVGQWSWSSW